MITNESSPLLQPLSDEPRGPQDHGSEDISPISPPIRPWWEPWVGILIAGSVWFLSVVCLLLVPLVFVVPYLIYHFVAAGPIAPDTIASDKTVLFLSILGVIPAHVVTFIIVWLAVTRLWPAVDQTPRQPFWKAIGFEWPKSLGPTKGFVISAMIAVVLLAFGMLITKFFGGNKTQLDLLIESSTGARIATAIIAFATAPLIEEIIYRGILY